jgi:hypothetical protein
MLGSCLDNVQTDAGFHDVLFHTNAICLCGNYYLWPFSLIGIVGFGAFGQRLGELASATKPLADPNPERYLLLSPDEHPHAFFSRPLVP